MKSDFTNALPFAIAVLFPAISCASTVLVDDTFDAAGNGGWYKGTTNGTLGNSSNQLSWAPSGNDVNQVIARQFSATTLAVGTSLRATYTFTQSSSSIGILRVGFYNFPNDFSADSWGAGASNVGGTVQGYYAMARDNDGTGNFARTESSTIDQNVGHGPLFTGTAFATDTTVYDLNQTGTVTYTVLFEVTRTSSTQMTTQFTLSSIDGTHFSYSGTTNTIYSTLDTLAIRSGGGTTLIDNVKVEFIPEPSAALLSGIGAAALLSRRGRKS